MLRADVLAFCHASGCAIKISIRWGDNTAINFNSSKFASDNQWGLSSIGTLKTVWRTLELVAETTQLNRDVLSNLEKAIIWSFNSKKSLSQKPFVGPRRKFITSHEEVAALLCSFWRWAPRRFVCLYWFELKGARGFFAFCVATQKISFCAVQKHPLNGSC